MFKSGLLPAAEAAIASLISVDGAKPDKRKAPSVFAAAIEYSPSAEGGTMAEDPSTKPAGNALAIAARAAVKSSDVEETPETVNSESEKDAEPL